MVNTISNDEKEMYLILHNWEGVISTGSGQPIKYQVGKKYWKPNDINFHGWWLTTDEAFKYEQERNGIIK